MVAPAVPNLLGIRRPHYALPLLHRAIDDFHNGHVLAAAARLREALRRWLHAECELHNVLPKRPTPARMARMLRRKDAGGTHWGLVEDLLIDVEDVLALRSTEGSLRFCLEIGFDLIEPCACGEWRDDDDDDGDVWKGGAV